MISLLPLIPFAYFGTRLSIIDFKSHRLPNRFVGWFALIEVLTLVSLSWIKDDFSGLMQASGIAGVTMLIYLFLYLVSRGSLGMGDVKFAFPLGLCVGWYAAGYWLVAIFASFLFAGIVAIIGLATKRMDRKSRIAFGPHMFLGTLFVCSFAVFGQ